LVIFLHFLALLCRHFIMLNYCPCGAFLLQCKGLKPWFWPIFTHDRRRNVNKRIFLTLISLILVLAVLTTGCAKAASGDQSLKKFRMPRPWSSVWTTLSRPWDTAMSPTKSSALTLMWPKKSPSAWVSSSTPADRLVPEIQRTQCRYHRLHLEWLYHHRGTSPADQRHISLHEKPPDRCRTG